MFTDVMSNSCPGEKGVIGAKGRLCFHSVSFLFLLRILPIASQPTPIFLPGESQGQRSLAGYRQWGCKDSDMTEPTEQACMHAHQLHLLPVQLKQLF